MTQEDGRETLVAIHIAKNTEFEFCRRITERVYNDMTASGIFAENPGVPAVETSAAAPVAEKAPEAPPAAKESRPAAEASVPSGDKWVCESCGQENIGNFCYNCGAPRPQAGSADTGTENEQAPGATETGIPEAADTAADSRIAFIESTFSCGCTGTSFGTMVGPRGMVVQSEALYCPEHGTAFTGVVFHFGKGKGVSQLDYEGDFSFKAYETFEGGFSAKNNIGYVLFPSAIGNTTGWYSCRVYSDEGLNGSSATVRSADDNWKTVDIPVTLAVRSEKQLAVPSSEYFYTGVPLFITVEGEEPVLVGIECASSRDGSTELFRRITERVYSDMEKAGVFSE